MKIAVDCRPAVWSTTGIGSIVSNFIKNIGSVDNENTYILYFDKLPKDLSIDYPNIHIKNCNLHSRFIWSYIFMSIQILLYRFDFYLSFLEKDGPLLLLRTKKISLICDLIPLNLPNDYLKNFFHAIYYKISLLFSISQSYIILTISEYSKKDILKFYPSIKNKVKLITLGHSDAILTNNSSVAQKYGIFSRYVLCFGSTEPRKNNIKALEAFKLISHQFSGVKLVIVGNPWRERQFSSEMLFDDVVLTGFVNDSDLAYLIKGAEIILFPSLYEGFGLPLLEGMSYGVPVVASNTTSLPEVGGNAVVYINPMDAHDIATALTGLLENSSLRSLYSSLGISRASEFSWIKMCKQISSLFADSKG